MTTDELLSMVLDVGLMLANDGNATDMRYRAGYQAALLNLLMLAKANAEEREMMTRNLRPYVITFNEPKAQ